jgi:pyruvate dehydrogenase (quinone)
MKQTASDILVETLESFGVDTIFGLPGDGINGIIEALRLKKDKIRFIHVRHEEAAAFAACAYAKYTGKLGVCLATSGPGGIHLLNGLYDAKMDGAPVLAITGLQFHDLLATKTQQDVELDKVFIDACVYNTRVMGPEHMQSVAELACRSALAYKGVAHITIPVDFQSIPVQKKLTSARNVAGHVSLAHISPSSRLPDDSALRAAADLLATAKKPVILCGRGALDATDELIEAAEILGAPIIKALLGKAAVPDDCVYTTGGIGLLGTAPSQEAMEDCDALLLVGTSFPYIEFYPKPGQARAIQIDTDAARMGSRYPIEIGLVGDSKHILQALIPMLKRNENRKFLQRAQSSMQDWWKLMKARGTRQSMPMKPQVVAWELGQLLPDNAIVSCDSGTIATWWARQIPVKRGQKHSISGNLASMACGLPYAIAAAIAFPDRPSIAFVGDGGFSMLMAEMSTCVKYNLNVKVIVIKNNMLGQIQWEQMVFLGNPEFGCSLEPIDFSLFARACGATGVTISNPADCGEQLARALATPGPVVIEAIVDPFEPPMPGKITVEQAMRFGESLARGTPHGEKIALTVLSDKVKELI